MARDGCASRGTHTGRGCACAWNDAEEAAAARGSGSVSAINMIVCGTLSRRSTMEDDDATRDNPSVVEVEERRSEKVDERRSENVEERRSRAKPSTRPEKLLLLPEWVRDAAPPDAAPLPRCEEPATRSISSLLTGLLLSGALRRRRW
mmetsp:Transcript_37689/g.89178  ORF Transcript_37689/g.89178 Transcript_37689/m.89178 type:complete len:148 (-) Transcript_37689:646-1089(-)